MRQSDTSHVAVTPAADHLRRLVMWAHVGLGTVALFVYLYSRLGHLPWQGSFASVRLIVIAAPVLLPYAISVGNCWKLDTWQRMGPDRLRVVAFIAVLIAGGALVDATLLGAFGQVERLILIGLLIAQTAVYFHAAEQMLDGGF